MKVGDRVGAICDSSAKRIRIYGYGVYEGDHPCPFFGDIPNPRIGLDNGQIVWGCECWWGPEDEVKHMVDQSPASIEEVDIEKHRQKQASPL